MHAVVRITHYIEEDVHILFVFYVARLGYYNCTALDEKVGHRLISYSAGFEASAHLAAWCLVNAFRICESSASTLLWV